MLFAPLYNQDEGAGDSWGSGHLWKGTGVRTVIARHTNVELFALSAEL